MTIIAARIANEAIRFASDSQTTAGWRRVSASELKRGKIFMTNQMTVGSAGYTSHACWFQTFCTTRRPAASTVSAISDFMLEFDDYMRKRFSDFKAVNQFLIAFEDRLFEVLKGADVFAVPEFAAIGSGTDYAIAAMHLGHGADAAAKVAADLDIYCSGDILGCCHWFDSERWEKERSTFNKAVA